jgi:hypothetical protein
MSILAGLSTFWGAVCSPSAQAVIGLANLGGTTYTAVKASQNSNKLSSLQSSVYGIARDLKEVKAQTTDLLTVDDMDDLLSGGIMPTTTTTTTTTTPLPTSAPTATAPTQTPAPVVTAQDNMPAWAQQLIQQQLQQSEVIKGLMQQQNTASTIPANTTVNVNPTPTAPAAPTVPSATATATDSVPTIPDTTPTPAPVDPALMAFLQQQAEAMNKLANAVTALEVSIGEIEAVIDDAPASVPTATTPPVPPVVITTPTTPTPPTGGRG